MSGQCSPGCVASLLAVASLLSVVSSLCAAPRPNPIVELGRKGKLTYAADEHGNRVPDFSTCGYAASERAIPDAPVRAVVAPERGDSTARIQRALDHVATLPPDSNGVRGAVLLLRGRHEVLGGLHLTNSGIVLRGQGFDGGGTVLVAGGTDRRTLITVAGRHNAKTERHDDWTISDDYVPVGATAFQLRDASGLKEGDFVRLIRPSTAAWIERLGATDFGGGVGGGWKPGTRDIVWERVIIAIDGHRLTVEAPVTTALESILGGGQVERFNWPGRIANVGVENLQLESARDPGNPSDEDHSWCAITMDNVRDAWVRQVTFRHFAGSAVALYETASRITVEDCLSLVPVSENGGGRRETFFTMGQQTLFLRCYAERGRRDFAVGHCAAGPNAFVQCEASLPLSDSGAIASWASGVLFDNVCIDGNMLVLGNRGPSRGGAGWAAANSVLWNCSAAEIVCASPPGARNWSFGAWAEFEGDGVWRSSNEFMQPESLFAAQLRDRLGGEAAKRIEFMPLSKGASSNPPLDQAQELAAASHQPAPLLKEFVAMAAKRNPILSEPGDARSVEDLPAARSVAGGGENSPPQARLIITNGCLTIGGKLAIGGTRGVAWWRGNLRSSEQSNFNAALTRFVPGRTGHGFTDDLRAVADAMIGRHQTALDHNYGLWYDRRRDDHQRVRRMDGDVWPPFFEQPFARSGRWTAWDGLSRYDLTKFNPWYWSRLRQFADICDERGLLLFHQNYFQHNILEAGAHWADSPWRTANNTNNTGFPEPPFYAGGKRIFMAEMFYDVTHPVRRELHRRYIRQSLHNFAANANVIQFTSAEFTGPTHFVEFWLDTIAEWQRENPSLQPLIALSTTKDVQDAILADRKRAAVVDVIDFRYWWRTKKGEFAPPGGKNLAPRQFERQWRGGGPDDEDLAGMAADYRAKFPGKPLLCNFDSAGWAWLCAGGSLPRLPKTTDSKLLAAIPRMQPWKSDAEAGRWVLREPGVQMLVFSAAPMELDLSGESGVFSMFEVNTSTGAVTPHGTLKAGTKVNLGNAKVVWLKRE